MPGHRSRAAVLPAAQHRQSRSGATLVPRLAPHPFLHHTARHSGTLHRLRSGPMGPGSPSSAFPTNCCSSPSPTCYHSPSPSSTHTPSRQVSPLATSGSPGPSTASRNPATPAPAARHSPARTSSQPALPLSARQLPLCCFSGWSPSVPTAGHVVRPARHDDYPPHCLQPAIPPPAGRPPGSPSPFSGCPRCGGRPGSISPASYPRPRATDAHVV